MDWLEQDPTLTKAIAVWETGEDIGLDLAAELISLGYEVERLERKYKRAPMFE